MKWKCICTQLAKWKQTTFFIFKFFDVKHEEILLLLFKLFKQSNDSILYQINKNDELLDT